MEEIKVPVLYTAVSNGGVSDPITPPDYVTVQGYSYFYNSNPHDKTDLLAAFQQRYPSIIKYLMHRPWKWRTTAEFLYIEEFKQWQIVIYYVFSTPGEGIMFAMWMAEQNFDSKWSGPLRQDHTWLN